MKAKESEHQFKTVKFSIIEADKRIRSKSGNQEISKVSGDSSVIKDRESRESPRKPDIDKIQAHQKRVYESVSEEQKHQYKLTDEEKTIMKQMLAQRISGVFVTNANIKLEHATTEPVGIDSKDFEILTELLNRYERGIETVEERSIVLQMLSHLKSNIDEGRGEMEEMISNDYDILKEMLEIYEMSIESAEEEARLKQLLVQMKSTINEEQVREESELLREILKQHQIGIKTEEGEAKLKLLLALIKSVNREEAATNKQEEENIEKTGVDSKEYKLLKEMLKKHEIVQETAEEGAKLKELITLMKSAMSSVTTTDKAVATIKYEQEKTNEESKHYALLKKLLKRQEMGIDSAEEVELMKLFLENSNIALQEMAQEYLSRSMKHRSDIIEPFKDVEFMDKALINRNTSITESREERELLKKHLLNHEDSGINDSEAKQDEDYLQPQIYHQDSGIARDISDSSNFSSQQQPGSQGYKYEQRLSPLKSSTYLGETSSQNTSNLPTPDTVHRKWQPFLDTESASERKKLEMVRKDYEAGNMKTTSLPPIRYIKDGPMVQGEAGLRLLHTVQFDKEKSSGERHRVQPMEARLSYHTQSQRSGQSDFGALKLRWTTQVPITNKNYQYHHQTTISTTHHQHSHHHRLQEECEDFQWDNPLPPAPPRTSRTLLHSADQFHKRYCKQYQLAKKKLHHYTSEDVKKYCLPRIVNTRDIIKRFSAVKKTANLIRNKTILQDLENQKKVSSHVIDDRQRSRIHKNLTQQSRMELNKFTQLPAININQLINNLKLNPIYLSEG